MRRLERTCRTCQSDMVTLFIPFGSRFHGVPMCPQRHSTGPLTAGFPPVRPPCPLPV
jgi:hypothetical protein